ncbi:MAG: sigma-54-dependent Fis family transcriptional regulator [Acidobacteriota bacterium]|nr:MAG: sigma-54-dependent Fis family transcriptional regulator [Acidobacteriota bacterium]
MREPDVDPAPDDLRFPVEEAYSLALRDRVEDALQLIDEIAVGMSQSRNVTPPALLFLAKARIVLARARAADRDRALKVLETLSRQRGDVAWLARLELAREARRAGRLDAARELVQRLRDELGDPDSDDAGASCQTLSRLLAAEALSLERAGRRDERRSPCALTRQLAHTEGSEAVLLRLVDLGRRLAAEVDPRQVLRMILHEAIELSATERGFIALVKGDELDFALAENIDWSRVPEPQSEIARTLVRDVVRSGRPVYLGLRGHTDTHPANRSLVDQGVGFAACLPIGSMGSTIGVLYLDRRESRADLGEHGVHLLDLFSRQAATALENAWLHQTRMRQLQVARESIRRYRSEGQRQRRFGELVGSSDAMQFVYDRLERIIPTDFPVLILGEIGTGKDLAARLIHERGPRHTGSFVAVNCAGVPDTLLEDELFGHRRGAFSGADRDRPGLFELADGGTLFLDHVGEMSLRMQAALLRALESGEVRRLSANSSTNVDVRIIAATHRPLSEDVEVGRFREDLFFRLNVLTLELPPLRRRPEDIPLLAEYLLQRFADDGPRPVITDRAMKMLAGRDWRGNVRELEYLLKRWLTSGLVVVDGDAIPDESEPPLQQPLLTGTLRQIEQEAIRQALERTHGHRTEAARLLGIDRKTLYSRLRKMEQRRGS